MVHKLKAEIKSLLDVLGDSLGSLRDGVLGELTRKNET
jgi:hypothetical protein